MIPLSKYTNDKGVCLLQKKQAGKSFVQDAPISRLILNDCEEPRFNTALEITGTSEHVFAFTPLISIWGESHNPRFAPIILCGEGRDHREWHIPNCNDERKQRLINHWNQNTPSGIDIRAEGVSIDQLIAKNLHDVLIVKNKEFNIFSGYIDTYSGDAFFIQDDNASIYDMFVKNAIKTIDYKKKHRDVGQLAIKKNGKKLSGIKCKSITYRDGDHELSQSPDGLIIHTDGELHNSEFINLDLIADTNEHGFSSVCATNCEIHAFQIKSRTGNKVPGITIVDRKGIGQSTGNNIDVPMGTWIDNRMNAVDNFVHERESQAGMVA